MSLNTYIDKKIKRNEFTFSSNTDVWCIGDVHGCSRTYEKLLYGITEKSKGRDVVIFQLGDLIAKGKDFYKCFLFSKAYDVKLLMGNHELSLFQSIVNNKRYTSKQQQSVYNKFHSLDSRQQDIVRYTIATSYTHAIVSIEGVETRFLLTHAKASYVELDNHRAVNYCYENELTRNHEFVNIHGHNHRTFDVAKLVYKPTRMYYNIDSGCVYGNALTGLRLNDFYVLQEDYIK